MTDIEERLSATFNAAAQDAPDAIGLAAGARRRHRLRRQRRIAVGGVVTVLVVVMAAVTTGTYGGDGVANDPTPTPPSSGAWQTIGRDGVVASVPTSWRRHECGGDAPAIHAPVDPCDSWTGAAFYGSSNYDAATGPGSVVGTDGVQMGHVSVGSFVLAVADVDRDLVRRVLASARVDGQPVVDGTRWVTFDRGGMAYEVPAWWGMGEEGDRSGYSVCLSPVEGAGVSSSEQLDATHYVMREVPGPEGTVVVTAPTQAVAELVMATVEVDPDAEPAPCTEEDFNLGLLPPEGSGGEVVKGVEMALDVVEFDDIVLEVPAGWSRKEDCGLVVQFSPGQDCAAGESGEGVRFLDAATFRPAMAEGQVMQSVDDAMQWGGFVLRGEYAVFVASPDKAVAELLLSRVRP